MDSSSNGCEGPAPDVDPILGRILKHLREEKGITPTDLERRAELDPGTLLQVERGILDPTWRIIEVVACDLGVSLSELATLVEESRQS